MDQRPETLDIHYYLLTALTERRAGHHDQAAMALMIVLGYPEVQNGASYDVRYLISLIQAEENFNNGNFEQALQNFYRAYTIYAGHMHYFGLDKYWELLFKFARCHLKLGNHETAIALLEKSFQANAAQDNSIYKFWCQYKRTTINEDLTIRAASYLRLIELDLDDPLLVANCRRKLGTLQLH